MHVKRVPSFVNIFGPDQKLGFVAVGMTSVPTVSIAIEDHRIGPDHRFDPGLAQNALGCLSMRS